MYISHWEQDDYRKTFSYMIVTITFMIMMSSLANNEYHYLSICELRVELRGQPLYRRTLYCIGVGDGGRRVTDNPRNPASCVPAGRGLVDEFHQRDPAVPTNPAQPCHLPAVPGLRLLEGRLPGEWCALLVRGAEVQGKISCNIYKNKCFLSLFLSPSAVNQNQALVDLWNVC